MSEAVTSRPQGYVPMTIAGAIQAAAARAPDKEALRLDERALSYRQLAERINRVANAVRAMGLPERANIALLAPNSLEYPEIVAGLTAAGHAVVTLSAALAEHELRLILEDSAAAALLVAPVFEEKARAALSGAGLPLIVINEGYETLLAGASAMPPGVAVDETDTMAIAYTSGTTGQPKGVAVSHRSRVLTILAMATEYGCYASSDRSLCIAPMFHGAGLVFALAPLVTGGSIEIMGRFNPEQTIEALGTGAITNVFMVPTHFNAIFALPEATLAGHDFSALRTIISNAAALPQATKVRIVEYFGDGKLFEAYGSTEAGIVCNLPPADQLRKERCVGVPFPLTEIKLLGDDGVEVAQGETGEVWTRSPYLFNGYWQRPEETAGALKDGWCSAGDLGCLDEDGYLYIQGRKKDMLISGGINIYPREIEETLVRHAAVAEAAVVGKADDYWGEVAVAFVVAGGDGVSEEALIAHCKGELADYKCPKAFHFIDALPSNPSGKILKRVLRERLEQGA